MLCDKLLQVVGGLTAIPVARFADIDQLVPDSANFERIDLEKSGDHRAVDQLVIIGGPKCVRPTAVGNQAGSTAQSSRGVTSIEVCEPCQFVPAG